MNMNPEKPKFIIQNPTGKKFIPRSPKKFQIENQNSLSPTVDTFEVKKASSKMKIHSVKEVPVPELRAFYRKWQKFSLNNKDIEVSDTLRSQYIKDATSLINQLSNGKKNVFIHDQGGFNAREIHIAVNQVITKALAPHHEYFAQSLCDNDTQVDDSIKHFVLGHGHGDGESWRFLHKGKELVQDYVNQRVPKDEYAYCIVCKSSRPVKIAYEGYFLKSAKKLFKILNPVF